MKTATKESNCGCVETDFLERPRFFPRQLITTDDLTLGQDYLRNKLRRLVRFLHGWGVVCGARVVTPVSAAAWQVVVQRGYILGPYGDEILIERDVCFDLRTRCAAGASGDACGEPADPWCADTWPEPQPAGPRFVAVRYKEMMSRPVRLQPAGCGCDDAQCEYSRWRDGYEICVLDRCPDSHASPPAFDTFGKPAHIPDCPDCPSEPWVVLATVVVNENGEVQSIDNCSCRRMVFSLAPFWWRCTDPANRRGDGGERDHPTPGLPVPASSNPTAGPEDK